MKKPRLCITKSGIYYVYIKRKRVYLGKTDKNTAAIRYNSLIQKTFDASTTVSPDATSEEITILELAARFLEAHQDYYRKDGKQDKQLDRFKTALSFPLALFAELPAAQFGAKKLLETRAAMIESGRFSRFYINALVVCIRHVWTWGVEQELVAPPILLSLRAVSPLKRGRSNARDNPPIGPVTPEVVDKTIPYLPPVVAAIVTVQRLSGMRPSEVLNMRKRDLSEVDGLLVYTLEDDKTAYKRASNDRRKVYLGPKAAVICREFASGKKDDGFLFVASENGKPYKSTSYGRAITRAAKRAVVEHWTPYQLRHLYATEVRARFGLEAAQTALGHKRADVTQIYAERDATLAARVAKEIG